MRVQTASTWNQSQVSPLTVALVLWSVLCLACCVRAYVQPERNNVFAQYAIGGQAWLQGTDAYGLDKGGELVIPSMSAYRYAPIVSVLLVPFSLVPENVGGVLWRLLNMMCFIGAFAWYVRDGLPAGLVRSEKDIAWLWVLLIPLSLVSVNNGQANVLTLALLLAAGAALAGERWNWAAAFLAGAFLLKLYPLAAALLLMLLYPKQLVWRFVIAIAIGLALPFAFQAPGYVLHAYENWSILIASDDRREFLMTEGLRDFYLLTRYIGAPLPPRPYLAVQLFAGALIAGIGLWGRWRGLPLKQQVMSMLTLGCAWMVLFGPAVESCTYILIAPALAFGLVDAWSNERSYWTRGALVVVLAMFIATYVTQWFRSSRDWLFIWQPLAALIFFVERSVRAVAAIRSFGPGAEGTQRAATVRERDNDHALPDGRGS